MWVSFCFTGTCAGQFPQGRKIQPHRPGLRAIRLRQRAPRPLVSFRPRQ